MKQGYGAREDCLKKAVRHPKALVMGGAVVGGKQETDEEEQSRQKEHNMQKFKAGK